MTLHVVVVVVVVVVLPSDVDSLHGKEGVMFHPPPDTEGFHVTSPAAGTTGGIRCIPPFPSMYDRAPHKVPRSPYEDTHCRFGPFASRSRE